MVTVRNIGQLLADSLTEHSSFGFANDEFTIGPLLARAVNAYSWTAGTSPRRKRQP
jgi:hypothetical protein